jgi:hypothetical protein
MVASHQLHVVLASTTRIKGAPKKAFAIVAIALVTLSATAAIPVGKYKCGTTAGSLARVEVSSVNLGGKLVPHLTYKHGGFKAEGFGTLVTEGSASVVMLPSLSSTLKFGVFTANNIQLEVEAVGGEFVQQCTRL